MKKPRPQSSPLPRMVIAAVLAWIVPGVGHLWIGERVRGIIFLTVIALTFWTGMAIGGVKNTVNPQQRTLWFMGQVCTGVHSIGAIVWSRQVTLPDDADPARWISYGQTEEVGVVYTAIAGMLNLLIILDVLNRAEQPENNSRSSAKGLQPRSVPS